jgi:hypothetical protein
MYARKLTKEDLMKSGITNVTEDGKVFKGEAEVQPQMTNAGYLTHIIFEFDEDGKRIAILNSKSAFGYIYKTRTIGLHRLMWAWFHDEVPSGMVVDHINDSHDKPEDYHLSNLQLLTPSENIRKSRTASTTEIRCKMDKPRSYYENQLTECLEDYEIAKLERNATAAHKLRTKLFQLRAKLRYWDSHKDLIQANIELQEATTEAKTEARMKKQLKTAHLRALRGYADLARSKGRLDLWHSYLGVIKNYEAFTEVQIEEIIRKAEERYNANH